MKNLVHFTTAIAPIREPVRRSVWRRYLLIAALASFVVSSVARAECRDGCEGNDNTFQGEEALSNLTTGVANTAVGADALFSLTTGVNNTAIGTDALYRLRTGIAIRRLVQLRSKTRW